MPVFAEDEAAAINRRLDAQQKAIMLLSSRCDQLEQKAEALENFNANLQEQLDRLLEKDGGEAKS